MGEGVARVITVGATLLTVGSLVFAVRFARRQTRIRLGIDVLRAAISGAAILLMAALTDVATPTAAIGLAILAGLGLGFIQGTRMEVTAADGALHARRTPIALALWGVGVVLMQLAGLASRSGTLQLGQTVAWFSVCLGVGLILGRNGPVEEARRTATSVAAAMTLAGLVLPAISAGSPVAMVGTTEPDHAAVCRLIESPSTELNPGSYIEDSEFFFNNPEIRPVSWCSTKVWFLSRSEGRAGFWVYRYESDADALFHFETVRRENAERFDRFTETPVETIALNVGTGAWAWRVQGVDDIVLIVEPPYVLWGAAMDRDRVETTPAYEQVLTPMVATLENIRAEGEAAIADEAASESQPSGGDPAPSSAVTGTDEPPPTAASDRIDRDDPIEPEDAAAQAIGGLIAAAAIGLISWAEASAEIGQILTGTRNTSILDPKTGPAPTPPDTDSIKDDPGAKEDTPAARSDPCAFQLDKYRKALADWQKLQNEIRALENEYALLKNRIENSSESDFVGAVFDLGALGIDISRSGAPSPSGFQALVQSAKQNYTRSITKQLVQAAATGQPADVDAIVAKAAVDATGLDAAAQGQPTSGAFGTWFNNTVTSLLAANRTYDYMKFMDTLAEPGAIADPEVMRTLERSSHESFMERIGPWVGVVTKYLDFYYKNQAWGEGVERRNKMGEELVRIRGRIDELEYDLGYATSERDARRKFLADCREEMG